MNEYSNVTLWIVITVAFIAGYAIVSFCIKKFSNATEQIPENSRILSEEEKHAQVLGFQGPVTVYDVKRAYHKLLSKYHPDKVNHLGDEFKQIAEQKTREIVAAYEYFRRKYNIT